MAEVQTLPQAWTGGRFVVIINNLNDKSRPVSWSCIIHERTRLFFMTVFLNQTQPVMHLSPRVRFNCAWLFAILLRLFSVLQNVLPRSSYFCSLPGGPKLLYTAGRSLHGCVFPFCGEASFKRIFLRISICTIVFTIRNIIHVSTDGRSQKYHRGKHSSIIHINLCRHSTVVCSFWLAWASPGGSGHVRGWLLQALWAAWFLWASRSISIFHFAGGGEGKAVVFQLNFWGLEIVEKM